MDLKKYIREIPNWPKMGINFKDITPLLQNANAFKDIIDRLAITYKKNKIDLVVGIDARGFLLASALAYKVKAGLAIVRKKGKLPFRTISQKYALEYASNTLEMHKDAIKKNQRILIIDDVLATGGTMQATTKIIEKLKGKIIGISFLIELSGLKGRQKIKKYPIDSLIIY